MNYFTKKRMAIWVIIFLLITNIATLATICYHRWNFKNRMMNNPHHKIEAFIKNELNLNAKQTEDYRKIKEEFRKERTTLSEKIQQNHAAMFDQYSIANPDTAKLNIIAKENGEFFKKMSQMSIKHFFNLRNICDEKQKVKLSGVYKEMNSEVKNKENHHPEGE